MNNQQQKWLYFSLLSLVWGSSFILMKKALLGVTPIQLGALRMIFTAVFLLSVATPSLKKIEKKHYKYIFYTAIAGIVYGVSRSGRNIVLYVINVSYHLWNCIK
jgi:drug/metabolite transporter (DMT)-like permease